MEEILNYILNRCILSRDKQDEFMDLSGYFKHLKPMTNNTKPCIKK